MSDKALIQPNPPADDAERVESIFKQIEEGLGFVPDAIRLYAISPPLLEVFVGGVSYFRGGTALSPSLTATIRYLVSWSASCRFCVDLNEGFLTHLGHSLESIRAARENPDLAPIETREQPLLKLALKAADDPGSVSGADLEACRAQGWSDREIFDAVVQAANNRALNLVLRTFKVEEQGAFA